MDEKRLRNRTIVILAVVVICILGIIGVPTSFDALRNSLRNRIRLGLDLSGGTHLILQVQVEDAVNVNSDLALERLRDRLTTDGIPYDEVSKVTPVEMLVRGIPQDAETSTILSDMIRDELLEWDLSGPTVQDGVASWRVRMRVTAARAIRLDALQKAISTIRRRVDALGVTEPTIQEHGQGDYEILVQLPGVDEPERVKEIIQRTAMLELKLVADGPFSSRDAALAARGGILPPDTDLLRTAPGSTRATSPEWYIVNRIAAVTGRDLSGANPSRDINGFPSIGFTLTRDGATRFGRITGQNVGQLLAIVLDGQIQTAPRIDGQIFERGEITGRFTEQETADLALVLREGALPASITYLEERTVGPSLGADSIHHGVVASIVGLLAVMFSMLLYYRAAGVNANVALILNLLILMAMLSYSGAVLTLPGIAGIVLTVGMAVDANVLIFERIREELQDNRAPGAAVEAGFARALVTIIDTNLTTILAAFILFSFGSGPIRGFAVTLTIGLVANLFTAIYVSRTIFAFVLSRRAKGAALSI